MHKKLALLWILVVGCLGFGWLPLRTWSVATSAEQYELFLTLAGARIAAARAGLEATDAVERQETLNDALVPLAVDAALLGAEGLREPVRVKLHHEGKIYTSTLFTPAREWQKFQARLKPTAGDPDATLSIEFRGPGTLWIDNISLMPMENVGGWRPDVVEAVLGEAAKFCEHVLVPLNRVGDTQGCRRNPDGSVKSMGIQCAFCHSTVDNSFAPGIGKRLDGWANRDLNVGAIVSLAPNLKPFTDLLSVDVETVKKVLASWGPGRYDAELDKDGKAFRPDGKQAGTLIPPAFGLAGVNLATWTGFGSVTYWNAYVAGTQMHGAATFFDARFNDKDQYPVSAKSGAGPLQPLSRSQRSRAARLVGSGK